MPYCNVLVASPLWAKCQIVLWYINSITLLDYLTPKVSYKTIKVIALICFLSDKFSAGHLKEKES